MNLAYLQSLNACDPLHKLGRKVEAIKDLTPAQKRKAHVHAFECMGDPLPGPIDLDLSKPESWPALPVVSFADAAEMAEMAEARVTQEVFFSAYYRAASRTSHARATAAIKSATGSGYVCDACPDQYPAAIAALEALQ